MLADFASGHTSAATRTQFLHAGLVDGILGGGGHRLLPIRDHEALARSIPGTRAGFIPSGLYGPERRIPAEPVPTIAVTQLLVARADIPGRVVRDILEVIYDPRFARDLQLELTEESGRNVGGLPLHRAADIYYHRNDLLTSDRLGRLSFVASAIAALVATAQFISRYRKNDRVAKRRRLLTEELAKLQSIRQRIDDAPDAESARQLMRASRRRAVPRGGGRGGRSPGQRRHSVAAVVPRGVQAGRAGPRRRPDECAASDAQSDGGRERPRPRPNNCRSSARDRGGALFVQEFDDHVNMS